ncbi:MAG: histidinol-phosphate transaminase [Sphingomonadaceae bacterium]|nr:histidinol-phosphate transaminase [Sphingomonadaceae bacterium]
MTAVTSPAAPPAAPVPKPWIDAIDAYVPGKAKLAGVANPVKLSSNESPLGPSPRAVEAMAAVAAGAHRYPDGGSTALREAIAAHHGLEVERIVCGTGSDELLKLLAQAYATVGDEVLYVRHGFMVYPIAARCCGATPVVAPDCDYTTDVDALLGHVTPRTRVVYLANPNNPTGTCIPGSEVRRLHAGLPGDVLLVLDHAYAEYIDDPDYEDGFATAREYANVVTTRTFSKIYGLAAERIGWAYGPQAIVDTLNKTRAPFNVPAAGSAGAIAALADRDWTAAAKAHNLKWRAWLAGELAKLGNAGLRAVPSAANFILVTFPEEGPVTAAAANAHLTADGILVRHLPGQGLPHALRISIGTEAEMRAVAASLRRFVERAG